MKSFKDLFTSELVSKSLLSARSFNFSDEEPLNRQPIDPGRTASASGTISSIADYDSQNIPPSGLRLISPDVPNLDHYTTENKITDPISKVEALQIKFLRLVHHIGQSPNNLLVAQVLYRLQLASLIRTAESGSKRDNLKVDQARVIAAQQEAAGETDMDFSCKILVLGRTGVGKSATINSIFNRTRAVTDAFQPATDHIQEISGTIKGIKATIIDTPGLSPSYVNQRRNRKILVAVRKFIRKSSPDVVLYFERLDAITRGYSDYPLLKLITDVFGPSIWCNTILVMTHSASPLPEGPDGYPISYEAYVGRARNVVQHFIHQAISSTQLENPFILVENHPLCETNAKGEKVLPNGQVWMSQFLLLCIATKVLGEANSLLKFHESFQLSSQTRNRLPSLPHLLSSFLRSHSQASADGSDNIDDLDEVSDHEEEDEYDQLPPIRILTKAQFLKLSNAQKNAYLDELHYRETLYLKKQWKEEVRRCKESLLQNNVISETDDVSENNASPEAVEITPDMTVPLSFDPDSPGYRYRCLVGNEQWLVRPVLDSQGWDHDVGYDGVNFEASLGMKRNRNLQASFVGQLNKDKTDLSIHSECTAKYKDPKGSFLAGIGIQTASEDLVCNVHGDAKIKNFCWNTSGCGLSLISFGKMYFAGAKLGDSIAIGRRFKVSINAGRMAGCGQVAHGGGLEATIKGKDYPVREETITLGTTILSSDKDVVLGGNFQSDFRIGRGLKFSLNATLNSRQIGQVRLKASTSEHVEIALIAVVSLFHALLRRRTNDANT